MCFPYHLDIDHIAYRTTSRYALAEMLRQTQNYKIHHKEFKIKFDDGSECDCIIMRPPISKMPEIFISDGPPDSIVGKWVKENGSGIHHIALRVPSDLTVEYVKKEWERLGWAEFLTEQPLKCEGLTQIFTKPSHLTGHIYELIERRSEGFCEDNVKALMEATAK